MSGPVDPLAAAQAELSAAMVPWPDDYVEDLTPPAALLVLRQMAMATLKVVAGATISLGEDSDEPQPTVDQVLNGVAAAIVGSTSALVALGALPAAALDALGPSGQ
ncbi:hypothetical protein [Mycobacterium sp.]|uniref:hypothetical protein n=1 Tax=Mycobacterium sp. TaxID=1785 RepID=UPI0031DB67EB